MTDQDGGSTGSEQALLADYEKTLDFQDLGFDMTRHVESLRAFARLGLDAGSIKPALRAREMVFVRIPEGSFLIGVVGSAALAAQERAERYQGCVAFEVIHRATDGREAETTRADVERYFQRHFPGRLLQEGAAAPQAAPEEFSPCSVYIALFAP